MIKENKLLKDFRLPSSNGKEFHLKKELKQNLIIYVYPKDNTPGCTTESIEFAKHYKSKCFKFDWHLSVSGTLTILGHLR